MDILLAESLEDEPLDWLMGRHHVVERPALAQDAVALRAALHGVQAAVLPSHFRVTEDVLRDHPGLKAVARLQAGTDHTDQIACASRGVAVVQPTMATVQAHVEYLLAGLMMLFRPGLGVFRPGPAIWPTDHRLPAGRELHGSTVGLVGLSPVGQGLALALQALGVNVIGYDPALHHSAHLWARLRIPCVPLTELLGRADAVSLQLPYATRYKGLMGETLLSDCRPGQLWVSASRSQLFCEHALAAALQDGRIAACLLDNAEAGFAGEDSPLHQLPNLYFTPNLGAYTQEARLRACWSVVRRLDECLSGFQRREVRPSRPAPLHPLPAGQQVH